ncbi:hypothetical protein Tco_0442990 [Tanacetum coccineum]
MINRKIVHVLCARGRRYENCDVAGQFVKHFEGFLGINPPVTKLTIEDAYLFDKKIYETEATIMTRDAWNVVKGEFCEAINEFFLTGKLLGGINATLNSLFPKSMTPKRIKSALNQIVDENHSAFVLGRAITDNILLTQELLKGYNCINRPKRCSFKIDIQKAYDTNGKLPVRYLGVSLVTKKIGVSYCKQLVDKVNQRLNDWKNKSLSYARRAQLIASVLGSMQVYWGYVFLLPKIVINDIERLFKKFLWNSGDSGKGRAKAKKESIWVKWINVVKLKQMSVWDVDADPKYSWGWKCILNLRSWVGEHIRYSIGDGKSISVWHDKWYNGTSLSSFISKKDVFFAGFNDLSKVSVFSNTLDKLVWVDNNGNDRSCEYAQKIWKQVCGMARIKFKNVSWDTRLNEMSKGKNKHSVWEVIRKLCLAADVYYIWQEKNLRLFNNSKRKATDLFGIMIEELKARMMSITVNERRLPALVEYQLGDALTAGLIFRLKGCFDEWFDSSLGNVTEWDFSPEQLLSKSDANNGNVALGDGSQ